MPADHMSPGNDSGMSALPLAGNVALPPLEPVQCGSALCEEAPLRAPGLNVQPCCFEGTECGIHVVGSSTIMDVCIPLMGGGGPNLDCLTLFDPELFVYRYGCCLDNGTCGEEPLLGPEPVSCIDGTLAGFPPGGPCDPANTCKRHDSPCTDSAECCPLSEEGPFCTDIDGTGKVCALHCQEDGDCPTLCCRPGGDGIQACAPAEMCSE